jgi:predicted transcriptional regulator
MTSKKLRTTVALDPRDQVRIDELADKKRSSSAAVIREIVGKALDAGITV